MTLTPSPRVAELQTQISKAQASIVDLDQRIAQADAAIAAAEAHGPADDFAAIVAGSAELPTRSAADLVAAGARLVAVREAGESQVARLRKEIVDVTRAEQARVEAMMSISDAVAFARNELQAIGARDLNREHDAAERRIADIEDRLATAWAEYGRAKALQDSHAQRYRTGPTPSSVTSIEELRADTDAAMKVVTSLRNSLADLRRGVLADQQQVASLAQHAFRHLVRLVTPQAAAVEAAGAAMTAFAKSLGTAGMRAGPVLPEIELPGADEMAALRNLLAPILAYAHRGVSEPRQLPQQRQAA